MTQQLTSAFRALADDLETGALGPAPDQVWRAGTRRRWRRRGGVGIAVAAVVAVLALVAVPADSLTTLPAAGDSGTAVTAYPQRIGHQWPVGTFHAGDGPVALLLERVSEKASWDEGLGWFTVSPGGHQQRLSMAGYGMPTISPDGRWVGYWAGADQGYLLQGTTSDAVVRFRDVPDPQVQVPTYWNARGDRVFVPSGGSSGVVGVVLGLDGSEVVVPRGPGSFPYGWMGDELVALVPRPAGSGTAFGLESWRAGGDWAPTGTVITVPEYAASRGLHQFTASLSPDATRLAIAVQTATSESVVEVRSYDLPSGAPVPWREVDPTTARVYTGDVSVPSREDTCPIVWRAGLPLTQLFGSTHDDTREGLELRRWMPSGSSRPITVTEDRVGGRCMLWATSALEGSPTWSVSGTSTSWLTWWWRELLAAAVLVVVVGWGLRARARRRAVSAILGG